MKISRDPSGDERPMEAPRQDSDVPLKRPMMLAVGTVLTGIGTIVLALATIYLARLGSDQRTAMERQVDLANAQLKEMSHTNNTMNNQLLMMQKSNSLIDNQNDIQFSSLYNAHRPYVYININDIEFNKNSSGWNVDIEIGNNGDTPALKLTYRLGCGYTENDIYAFFTKPDMPDRLHLSSRGSKIFTVCTIGQRNMEELIRTNSPIFVYGRANYRDHISNDTHITEFCTRLEPVGINKQQQVSVPQYECPMGHDCEDEDCSFLPPRAPPPRLKMVFLDPAYRVRAREKSSAARRHQKIPVAPPSLIPRIPHLSSGRFVPKNNQFLEVSSWAIAISAEETKARQMNIRFQSIYLIHAVVL